MFKKYLSSALIALVLNLAFYSTATANSDQDAEHAEKVKAEIARLGSNNSIKITVKLKDGTQLKGFINEIKDSSVIVRNEKTRMESEISYSQIRQTKQNKNNHRSTAAVTLKVVLVLGLLGILGGALNDNY